MSDPKNVVFTKHAMQRARERHLWKYVNKTKFFFDAVFHGTERAILDECIYIFKYNGDKAYIITMLHI